MTDKFDIIPKASAMCRTVLNPVEEAKKQHASYVSKKLNISYEDAYERVSRVVDNSFSDPVVEHYHRKENGDKEIRFVTMTEYLTLAKDKVLAPTFTQYYTEKQKPAMLARYVANNLKMRKVTKGLMFAAFANGDESTGIRLDYTQANWKSKSNDITGLFRSMGSALYSPSCHTTLTSESRIVTSTNNTSSERLLQGRRHYSTYNITINNLNSIVSNLGSRNVNGSYYNNWLETIEVYTIHVPSVVECLKIIKRSTKLYWYNPYEMDKILKYLLTLDDVERCAISYSGDFHSFRVYNPDIVRTYLSAFTKKHTGTIRYNSDDLKNINDELLNYIHHRFAADIKGLGVDYSKYPEQIVSDMCMTALASQNVLVEYMDLLSTLFVHPNLPPVVFDVFHMVRDSVLMSDTDSGANTLQEWVMWYYDSLAVNEESLALATALVYLNGIVVKVYVKQVGRNVNMSEERLDDNVMELKNEFTWIVFGLMSIAKHYFSGVNVREGNVFERKLEIKGGSLKSNSIPNSVKKDVVYDKIMDYILTSVETTGKVSLYRCIDEVIRLEQSITDDIYNGGHTYVRKLTINEPSAYKITDIKKNAYQHCVMWNDVFSDSTGHTAVAPYLTYKYPTSLKNKTRLRNWLAGITNPAEQTKLTEWIVSHNKSAVNIFYLPATYVNSYGIPEVIRPAVDTKRVILDLVNMAYIVLETLAYYKPMGLTLSEVFPERAKRIRSEDA